MKSWRAVELFEGEMAAVATDANRRHVNSHGKRASSILVNPISGDYPGIYATATARFLLLTNTRTRRAHGVEAGCAQVFAATNVNPGK